MEDTNEQTAQAVEQPTAAPDVADTTSAPQGTPPADTDVVADTTIDAKQQTPELILEPTGNQYVDTVVSVLSDSGITAEESTALFKEAMETLDADKVDYTTLEKRIGKAQCELVKLAVKTAYAEVKAKIDNVRTQAHTKFGGEDKYTAAIEAIKSTDGGKKLIADLKPLLDTGSDEAIAYAIDRMHTHYASMSGVKIPSGAVIAGTMPEAKTHRDYAKEYVNAKTATEQQAILREWNGVINYGDA